MQETEADAAALLQFEGMNVHSYSASCEVRGQARAGNKDACYRSGDFGPGNFRVR